MHATTQPVATNSLPGTARAAVIAVIVIVAAGAGFLAGTALQGSDQGASGGFSAAELEYVDQSLQIARQEASIVAGHQAPMFEALSLQIARQVASAATTQQSPATWDTDNSGPALR